MVELTEFLLLPSILLEYPRFTNSQSELPFHSEETVKIKLSNVADEPPQGSFTLSQGLNLGSQLEEFPTSREEPKRVVKNLVMIGAYDSGRQIFISLYTYRQDLLKPQNGSKKQDGKTLRVVFELLSFQRLRDQKKKACKIAAELLQTIPIVFPAWTDQSIIQTCKQTDK